MSIGQITNSCDNVDLWLSPKKQIHTGDSWESQEEMGLPERVLLL